MSVEQGEGERMEPASIKYKILCQMFCRSKKRGSEIVSYLHFAFKKALDPLFLRERNEFLISFVPLGSLSRPLVGWMEGETCVGRITLWYWERILVMGFFSCEQPCLPLLPSASRLLLLMVWVPLRSVALLYLLGSREQRELLHLPYFHFPASPHVAQKRSSTGPNKDKGTGFLRELLEVTVD